MVVLRAIIDSVLGNVKPLYKEPRRKGELLHLFHVGSGDCSGCALEVKALQGAAFDSPSSGLIFVEHPSIANILLMTGILTRPMVPYLELTWSMMPVPKAFVLVGTCAINGGIFEENYVLLKNHFNGTNCILEIEGCPPSPQQIFQGLTSLIGVQPPALPKIAVPVSQHRPSVEESSGD